MRDGVITEADTCREFVTPRLIEAGWGAAPHAIGEQRSFTNGRIIVAGGKVRRGKFVIGDALGSPGDSLEVVLTGEKAGLWTDRADGNGTDQQPDLDATDRFAGVAAGTGVGTHDQPGRGGQGERHADHAVPQALTRRLVPGEAGETENEQERRDQVRREFDRGERHPVIPSRTC